MAKFGFCFTLNNYTPDHESKLKSSISKVGIKYIVCGKEIGTEKQTPHLQGYLQSSIKIKNRFHKLLGIYVTPQERSATQAREYCMKDGNFFEKGTFDSSIKGTKEKKQGSRTDIEKIQKCIREGYTYEEIRDKYFATVSKIYRFVRECIQDRDNKRKKSELREMFQTAQLRPWQQELLNKTQGDPSPREIMWYWENTGGTGKSWMAKYLMATQDAVILTSGKKSDIAYIFSKQVSRIVIFDLSRTQEAKEGEHFLDGIYSLAEEMKNGYIVSTKYESQSFQFQVPHVIFFANFLPDMTKWSRDRYVLKEIGVGQDHCDELSRSNSDGGGNC